MQAYGVAIFLQSIQLQNGMLAVPNQGLSFILITMLSMSTGTMLLMWLGEQIDDRGVGNGISLIIFIGIYFYFLPSRLVIKNLFFYRIKFSAIFSNPLIILPPDSIDANKLC